MHRQLHRKFMTRFCPTSAFFPRIVLQKWTTGFPRWHTSTMFTSGQALISLKDITISIKSSTESLTALLIQKLKWKRSAHVLQNLSIMPMDMNNLAENHCHCGTDSGGKNRRSNYRCRICTSIFRPVGDHIYGNQL